MQLLYISSYKFADTACDGASPPTRGLQSYRARTAVHPREDWSPDMADYSRTESLLVIIVAVCRDYKHDNLRVVDSIDKAVLL